MTTGPGPARAPLARSLLACALLACALCAGCGRAPGVRFEVTASSARPDSVAVTEWIDPAPRDSLVVRGYADASAMHVSGVEASGPSGASIAVRAAAESIAIEGRRVPVPCYVLHGPLPSRLLLRYRVAPGARGGDAHTGFTGTRYGYAGPSFMLLTGRSLFLLPQPAEALRDLRVRFALPPGWRAVTPWSPSDAGWRTGLRGRFAAEHLVAATIGLGSFRGTEVRIGRTRYRFEVEAGLPAPDAARAVSVLEEAARSIHAMMGRELGPRYLTVIVPPAPDGDQVRGESWATGQGGTLAPATGGRVRWFAQSLLGAYLRDAPYRAEVGDARDYWLVDGLERLDAMRVLARAGFVDPEEEARQLAVSYLEARRVQGAGQDLERLYDPGVNGDLGREVLAPYVLASLDHEIRAASGGRDSLDAAVARLFRARPATSFWSVLPRRPGGWEEFRDRYVRGAATLPADWAGAIEPTRPAPSPAPGSAVESLTIAFTGDTYGFLEHCGCKVNQSGGVARRATVLGRIRRRDPQALLLDAGNAFLHPDRQVPLDFLSREEQRLYLEAMAAMRYDAAAIGATELTYGSAWFREATAGAGVPYACANLRSQGVPVAPGSILLRAHGLRVAVIGAIEPPRGAAASALFESNTIGLDFGDPVAAVAREAVALRGRADLLVAMGRLTPPTIRRLVARCPDLALVISTEAGAPSLVAGAAGGEPRREDTAGYLGRTLVLYTDLRNYGLASVVLRLDREHHVVSARATQHWLYEEVPDDPRVRAMLTRFYGRVGTLDSAQASVAPLFPDSASWMRGGFVGARRCAPCHAAEDRQWRETPHAAAFKTLLDAHRHYQPRCVVCHTVGYGTPRGYRVGDPGETLAGVQCEACHGPGGAHVADPTVRNIRRAVPEAVCLACHTPDHSDGFEYASFLPRVRHEPALVRARGHEQGRYRPSP